LGKYYTQRRFIDTPVSQGRAVEVVSIYGKGRVALITFSGNSPDLALVVEIDGDIETLPSIRELYSANLNEKNNVLWVSSYTSGNYSCIFADKVEFNESLKVKVKNMGSNEAVVKSFISIVWLEEW